MKLDFVALLTATIFLGATVSPSFAAIDMDKWESFVRIELQSVAQQVDKTGKAPVGRPLVGEYDTNKDNFIDAKEVKAIKAYLGNAPQVQAPAVQAPAVTTQKPQTPSPYQAPAPKETKKKEWWRS